MSIQQGNGGNVVAETRPAPDLLAPAGATVTRYMGPALPDDVGDGAAALLAVDEPVRAPAPTAAPIPALHRLRAGCYLLRYTPTPHAITGLTVHYDGTMRIERDATNTIASGDLYVHRPQLTFPFRPPKEPDPHAGVPVFPLSAYRYYVRVTQILEGAALATQFTLGFEMHRFDQAIKAWSFEGAYTALMRWIPAPPGYPSPSNYLAGAVRNSAGRIVGTFTMGWVSSALRRAVIEIDRESQSETVLANAAGVGWHDVFRQVGWDVSVDESDADVVPPTANPVTDAELHQIMLARRDSADLDREWRYWVVCVRLLSSTPRGIMFDTGGTDSNNVPREGAGISSHWVVPNADPWGLLKGVRFGTSADAYFRTAVHEIGHAMGLYHNTVDNGFMNTTDVIAGNAVPPQQFPQNIKWAHAPDDQKRLRHMPDMWVRPGGVPFGNAFSTAPISPDDAVIEPDGVRLDVQPLLTTVPLGAPVRVDMALRNAGGPPVPAPADLSLRAGSVEGSVTDPAGTTRRFRTIVRCIETQPLDELAPDGEVAGSLTLLRGPEGALFPMAGPYTVHVEARWEIDGVPLRVAGDAAVMVTPPVDDAHAEAALRVLSTPDALVTLALGGDHLEDGIEAIGAALDNEVLRPHFAFVEAKRVAEPFFDRKPDLKRAGKLLDDAAVMSGAEVKKASRLVAAAKKRGATPPAPLVKTIRKKAREAGVEDALGDLA